MTNNGYTIEKKPCGIWVASSETRVYYSFNFDKVFQFTEK